MTRPLLLSEVPSDIIQRWKRQEQSNRRRARKMGAEAVAVDFVKIVCDSGALCCICGSEIDIVLPGTDNKGLTLEHPISLGQGGHHAPDNVRPAHRECNFRKNNEFDTPAAAKVTAVWEKHTDHLTRMTGAEPPVRKKKRKIPQPKVSALSKNSKGYRKRSWK